MKKIFSKLAILLLVGSFALSSCHSKIWDEINDLNDRVTALETLCKQMNQDISALQTIVNAIASGDYITNIIEIKQGGEVVGYSITFSNHDPITIYSGSNGKDGKDGKDGKNGTDGTTPVIGVQQDNDGIYYWTLNGSWLLDAAGNKIQASASDGRDAVTPQLKIEDGYWFVSYDNGSTWAQLGQATGHDGSDASCIFVSVTQDDDTVTFVLSDGSTIVLPKTFNSNTGVPGALPGVFTVAKGNKIYFSKGNLQYNLSSWEWRFAEHQYDYIGHPNYYTSYTGYIDLFIWGYSGYKGTDPAEMSTASWNNVPTSVDIEDTKYDWGVYNRISNGGNMRNVWRTITKDEILYLINSRTNASDLHTFAVVENVSGLVLLPDNWVAPQGDSIIIRMEGCKHQSLNTFTASRWAAFEANGAVFLPACTPYNNQYGIQGTYWTATSNGDGYIRAFTVFTSPDTTIYPSVSDDYIHWYGTRRAVRLVTDW